ncbi:MAG: SHOCT domain-containing protein [Actinomycetota bacterium]
MMWDGWGPDGWAGWLFMAFTMALVWGGLIALVVWAVRSFAHPTTPNIRDEHGSDALAILEQRFARGEIDRGEFEERRAVLRDQSAT